MKSHQKWPKRGRTSCPAPRRAARAAPAQRAQDEETSAHERDHAEQRGSAPGQSTPAPSPPQKQPKLVSIRPTANLSVFSGTRSSGPRTRRRRRRRPRPRPRRRPPRARAVLRAAEGEDDEGDLEALEQDALERDGERVPVDAARGVARPRLPLAARAEGRGLVVQGHVAGRAQDRLAQPLQPEGEQQRADETAASSIGISVSAGPRTAKMRRARASQRRRRSAASASRAGRPPSTIVSASTASTALARNAPSAVRRVEVTTRPPGRDRPTTASPSAASPSRTTP